MKKKKGFTLIELIAVLVIMAIIALIVTPLVMTIIRKAKDSAAKRSVDAYGRSIDIAIAAYILDNAEFPDSLDQLNIEYSGKEVNCEIMALNEDAGAYLSECRVGNYNVKDSSTNDGWYHYEAKNMASFDYKTGDTVTYKGTEFQVIKNSKTGDDTVTLIKSTPLTSAEILAALGVESSSSVSENGLVTLGDDISESGLKIIVDGWAAANSLLVNNINDNVRLITESELINNLKYTITGNQVIGVATGSIDWEYYQAYWAVNNNNQIINYSFVPTVQNGLGATNSAYIRPVIEIQKSSAIVKN